MRRSHGLFASGIGRRLLLLFVIAAGIAVAGAVILFTAHRVLPQVTPATSR